MYWGIFLHRKDVLTVKAVYKQEQASEKIPSPK